MLLFLYKKNNIFSIINSGRLMKHFLALSIIITLSTSLIAMEKWHDNHEQSKTANISTLIYKSENKINPRKLFKKFRQCPCWAKPFTSYTIMLGHIKEYHFDEDLKLFICPKCKKPINKLSEFILHIISHTKEKVVLCSECFRTLPKSKDHFGLHTKYEDVFRVLIELKILKNNIDEDLVNCPFCAQTFSRFALYVGHIDLHKEQIAKIIENRSIQQLIEKPSILTLSYDELIKIRTSNELKTIDLTGPDYTEKIYEHQSGYPQILSGPNSSIYDKNNQHLQFPNQLNRDEQPNTTISVFQRKKRKYPQKKKRFIARRRNRRI